MKLQDACIESARRYFDFLQKENLGLIEIAVRKLKPLDTEGKIWELGLARKVPYLEAIELKVRGQSYVSGSEGHFEVDSYDDETGVLILLIRREIGGLQQSSADQVFVVSNLRFLVKNVESWFVENGHECTMPTLADATPRTSVIALSDEQQIAFDSVLRIPCSYVWGPPGTGKTKRVLTSAAIALLIGDRRVAVVAPTNLALDTALRSILEESARIQEERVLEPEAFKCIDRNKFIRLGVPSKRFADDYPEVCEVGGLRRLIQRTQTRISALEKVIRYRKNQSAIAVSERAIGGLGRAIEIKTHWNNLAIRRTELETRRESIERTLESWLGTLTAKITGSLESKRQELADCKLKIEALSAELPVCESQFVDCVEKIAIEKTGSPLLDSRFQAAGEIRMFDDDCLQKLDIELQAISRIHQKTVAFLAAEKALADEYPKLSPDELSAEHLRLKGEIEEMRQRTTEVRLPNSRLIGCTLDTFIGRFCDSALSVDHIFLDEACYAPVIKALTLFRGNVPITLLGDHKQLPPICEMKFEDLGKSENQPCVLWNKPATFARSLLQPKFPDWDDLFVASDEPAEAARIPRWQISKSFRFGQNLATLLSELFYGELVLTSDDRAKDLQVEVISAQRSKLDRSNADEADAILKILASLGDPANIAVLTPYKKQVALLRNILPRQFGENILTVHAAQGREWPIVVFSAADTSTKPPYFTDTSHGIGRLVMNTAMSRVKSQLILVCDTAYWLRQRQDANDQFISRLIKLASRSSG